MHDSWALRLFLLYSSMVQYLENQAQVALLHHSSRQVRYCSSVSSIVRARVSSHSSYFESAELQECGNVQIRAHMYLPMASRCKLHPPTTRSHFQFCPRHLCPPSFWSIQANSFGTNISMGVTTITSTIQRRVETITSTI